ncbi:MAG: nucleoside deaminase [Bacteroidota bacterium]
MELVNLLTSYIRPMDAQKDEHYMRLALAEAQRAYDADEVPVGAIVVQDDRILGRGYNQVEMLSDPTAHAEIIALTSAFSFLGSKYLPGATLYVTVEPCHMCAGALYWSKIGRIVYGAGDVKHGYRSFYKETSPFHPKTKLTSGVLEQECAGLMISFFQSKR